MGSAASVNSLPELVTEVDFKSIAGAVFDRAWFDEHKDSEGKVDKAALIAAATKLGYDDTNYNSKIVLRNLNQFVKVKYLLDKAWAGYPDTADLKRFTSFWKEDNRTAGQYRQQRLGGGGEPVRDLAELMDVARAAEEQFPAVLDKLLESAGLSTKPYDAETHQGHVMLAPLKGKARIEAKTASWGKVDPGPPCSWIFDVVRATYLADTPAEVAALLDALLAPSGEFELTMLNNRCCPGLFQGYRDMNTNLRIRLKDGTLHACELQVHLREIKSLAVEHESHETYEFFRRYFDGNSSAVKERLAVMVETPLGREEHGSCEALVESALSEDHRGLSRSDLTRLGDLLNQMGELGLDERLRRRCVETARVEDGEESGEYARYINNLGQLLSAQASRAGVDPASERV